MMIFVKWGKMSILTESVG